VEGRDIAMINLYDDPLVYRFLYSHKRAICDVVKAVLSHDPRLRQFASVPPLLKVPSWTVALVKPKPRPIPSDALADALGYCLPGKWPTLAEMLKERMKKEKI
jgi:hypothetical protein